jgi:hypothetical protein
MKPTNRIVLAFLLGAMAISTPACNNSQGGFSGAVGNTPATTPETSYKVLGNVGMPFTALVSDSRSSWSVQGSAPYSITMVNVVLPARVVVTKLVSDNSLMSIEIISGNRVVDLASTTDPYGTVAVEAGGTLAQIAPPANPDLEVHTTGPTSELFNGLIEDVNTGYTVQDFAPAVDLFDSPDGKVTAQLFQVQSFGALVVNMTLNGKVVASGEGADVTVSSP